MDEDSQLSHDNVADGHVPEGGHGPDGHAENAADTYGFLSPWLILILLVAAYYLKEYFQKLLESRRQSSEDAAHHKDPDAVLARQEAIDAARKKMQEKYDQQAQAFAEQQRQKAEAKRRELIEDWERHQAGQGYKSKTRFVETTDNVPKQAQKPASKSKLKPEYSPLMGNAGATCFRPTGRRGASGGG